MFYIKNTVELNLDASEFSSKISSTLSILSGDFTFVVQLYELPSFPAEYNGSQLSCILLCESLYHF